MTGLSISTHVLDTASGEPAAGVPVELARLIDGAWAPVGAGVTDADGRVGALVPADEPMAGGRFRVLFQLEAAPGHEASWYPEVAVVVDLVSGDRHTHIPLLLAPFGYTTYRGS